MGAPLRLVLLVSAAAVLAGCGQHFDVVRTFDRNAVLLRCSTQVVASSDLRSHRGRRTAMNRLEACMAEQRLPGYAVYDTQSHAVRYAYEADRPHLRF